MAVIETTIKNQLKEIEQEFIKLEKNIKKKVLLPAMREGTKIVKTQAKANASKWKSIRKLIKGKTFISKSGDIIGKIFIDESKDRKIELDGRQVGFEVVANILEFGRAAPNNGGGEKAVQPTAFMRNAPRQAEPKVMSAIQSAVIRGIQKV